MSLTKKGGNNRVESTVEIFTREKIKLFFSSSLFRSNVNDADDDHDDDDDDDDEDVVEATKSVGVR